MEMIYSKPMLSALLNAVRDKIDAGGGRGTLTIFSGIRPDRPDMPPSANSVLLATLKFTRPSAPDAEGGRLRFNPPDAERNAPAAGRAAWARIADSLGRPLIDVDVTPVGGGGLIELDGDGPDIAAGGVVRITSIELGDT